jgi:hypothetical protein
LAVEGGVVGKRYADVIEEHDARCLEPHLERREEAVDRAVRRDWYAELGQDVAEETLGFTKTGVLKVDKGPAVALERGRELVTLVGAERVGRR